MSGTGAEARQAAWQILRAVRQGAPFEAARDAAVMPLAGRDRRLAQELAAGVLRQRAQLDDRLRGVLAERWRRTAPDLRDLLRLGLYQLEHLDRVPRYAAVSSTVEAARPAGKRQAAFVNAVLRRLVERAAVPDAASSVRHDAASLSRRFSHPAWLVRRWLERFGLDTTTRLLAHNNERPSLVIQPARWSMQRLTEELARAGHDVSPAWQGRGLVLRGVRPQALPGFAEGGFIVQGPAQAALVAYADLPGGCHVWDACAAPGGKAVALSRGHPVIASDVSRARASRLIETLHRAAPAVPICLADALHAPFAWGALDAVWLDAPCTATGTMARHPDARWRITPRRLRAVSRRQEQLLQAVAKVVRAGGFLVYSTCSLEPEENAEQIERFLRSHPDVTRWRDDLTLLPTETQHDGGFLAVLRRQ